MKNILNKILLLLPLLLLISCSNSINLKNGKYSLINSKDNHHPYIVLKKEGEFILSFSVLSSYMGHGYYSINGNELILKSIDGDTYNFKIDDDKLIFKKGKKLEEITQKDSVFIYLED